MNKSDWMVFALYGLKEFCKTHRVFAIEEYRSACNDLNIPNPDHPNSWGALALAAKKLGLIRFTGEYRQARNSTAHARIVKIWEAII